MIVALLEVAVCVKKLFADSAYAGPKLQDALKELGVSELIEIVPKPKGAKGFTVLSGVLHFAFYPVTPEPRQP